MSNVILTGDYTTDVRALLELLRDGTESLVVSCQLLESSESVLDRHHAKQNLERWTPIWRELDRNRGRDVQPAAGEREQQTAINADDLPTKKYPLGALDLDSPAAAPVAAGKPVALSEEAMSTIVGMVELCLERRYCMGMDEGFKSFEPEVEHDFVKELRAFVDGAGKFPAAPPAAAHGDEAAATLAKALSLLWKTTNFLPRGGSLDGRVSAFLAQHAPEPVASAAAMRTQGEQS
jgi:hypothetical protein